MQNTDGIGRNKKSPLCGAKYGNLSGCCERLSGHEGHHTAEKYPRVWTWVAGQTATFYRWVDPLHLVEEG